MTVQADIALLLARVGETLDMPLALRAELATALNAAGITNRVNTAVTALNVPVQVSTAVDAAVPAAATAAVAAANITGQVATAVTAQVAPAVAQATAGSANVAMVNVWLNSATGVDTAAGTSVAPVATIDGALAKILPGGRGTIFLQGPIQINKLAGNPDRVVIDQGRSVTLKSAGNGRHEVTWSNFSAVWPGDGSTKTDAWRQFELAHGSALLVTGLRISPPSLGSHQSANYAWNAIFNFGRPALDFLSGLASAAVIDCHLNVPVTLPDNVCAGRVFAYGSSSVDREAPAAFVFLSNTWVNTTQRRAWSGIQISAVSYPFTSPNFAGLLTNLDTL
jgi:hypothetical protein